MRPMLEDVHDQFPMVGVGHTQPMTAVGQQLALLPRMPLLERYPAGALGRKVQPRSPQAQA